MKNLAYARKKRQLKLLSKKLQLALGNKKDYSSDYLKRLLKKISLLLNELKHIFSPYELKRALGMAAVFFGLAYAPAVSAQKFASPVTSPFGLVNTSYYAVPAFADLDGDGDFDLLVGEDYGGMQYFQNTGTMASPQFAAPQSNPFGMSLSSYFALPSAFVDLDGDGDYDLLVGEIYGGDLKYLENTGSTSSPQFAAPQTNPFGLSSTYYVAAPAFADLDNDGDMDLLVGQYPGAMAYFENTGSPTTPQFAAPQINPFGLVNTYYIAMPAFADLDNDGDLDLLVGEGYGNVQYFENTGTMSAPQFAAPQMNPFGVGPTNTYAAPAFADLDSDGDMDLLIGEYYGGLIYFENYTTNASIDEDNAFKMELYPNPVKDEFKLLTTEAFQKVEILSVEGKLIRSYNDPEKSFLIKDLGSGTYLVKVTNRDNESVIQKLFKQ